MKLSGLIQERLLRDFESIVARNCFSLIDMKNMKVVLSSHFVQTFAIDVYSALVAYCPSYKFKISLIYTDEAPEISFGDAVNRKKSSIGDILFVYDEQNNDNEKSSALLLCGRILKDISYRGIGSQNDFFLSNATEFNYKNTKQFSSKTRAMKKNDVDAGVRYLMMTPLFDSSANYICAKVDDVRKHCYLNEADKFAMTLLDLLQFSVGQEYFSDAEKHENSDWSNIISDLTKPFYDEKLYPLWKGDTATEENVDISYYEMNNYKKTNDLHRFVVFKISAIKADEAI